LRIIVLFFLAVAQFGMAPSTAAAKCRGDALGVSRTLSVNTRGGLKVGLVQYDKTLPLRDREVVLTFDDGPIGRNTQRVLDILARECVKATFFVVGRMAKANPGQLKAMQRAGHTIAAHSNRHPLDMRRMSMQVAKREINDGIQAINTALGTTGRAAPFFRYPGLAHSASMNNWLKDRNIGIFSADVMGDDWQKISSGEVLQRTMRRLNRRGRGIVLLHDIQKRTVSMLPALLRQLKKNGYRIVHIVPGNRQIRMAKTVPTTIRKALASQ